MLAGGHGRAWFREHDPREPRVGYVTVLPGETFTSQCHDANKRRVIVDGNIPNAFYCAADTVVEGYQGTIIIPVLALRRIWDGDLYDAQWTILETSPSPRSWLTSSATASSTSS
jgi:hypothetical protein